MYQHVPTIAKVFYECTYQLVDTHIFTYIYWYRNTHNIDWQLSNDSIHRLGLSWGQVERARPFWCNARLWGVPWKLSENSAGPPAASYNQSGQFQRLQVNFILNYLNLSQVNELCIIRLRWSRGNGVRFVFNLKLGEVHELVFFLGQHWFPNRKIEIARNN